MRVTLDRLLGVALEARLLAALLALATIAPGSSARAEEEHGASLPTGASKVAEGRFNSPMNWEATLKWYGKVYPRSKYEWIDVVNRPGLRALHIKNAAKGEWEGINIYEHGGRVKVFVLERQ